MTYNHFNELKRSFERCAAPELDKPAQNMRKQAAWPAWMRGGIGNIAAAFGGSPKPAPAPAANYGFGARPGSYSDAPMGGLDVYEGAKTTGMSGEMGYGVQQAYNEAARDAAAKFNKPGAADMEKAGGNWFAPSKWIGESAMANPIRGRILPGAAAAGAGYAGYESTGSLGVAPAAALGMYGMLAPAAIARMKAKSIGSAAKSGNWPKGMTAEEAFNKGLTKMSPEELASSGMNQEIMKGLAIKGGLMTLAGGAEYAVPMLNNLEATTAGSAEQMAKSPDVVLTYTGADGKLFTEQVPGSFIAGGGDKAVESSENKARKRYEEGTWPALIASGQAKVRPVPTFAQGAQRLTQTLDQGATRGAEFIDTNAPKLTAATENFLPAATQVATGLKAQSDEAGRWRQSIGDAVNKAAPAGAGALGGYVLSQLLGPSVKEDETPNQKEKRERLQRIYNLLGVTGGGGLGYYLANRLGGGEKTSSDTRSLDIIANLGRVAARDGLH